MPPNFENSAVATELEKGQLSLQSQRKAIAKNVQTTIQLCSFHMLANQCSKSFKVGFSSTGTKNFQMFKLDLENAEEWEIKLPTCNWKSKGIPEKNVLFCFIAYTKAFDCADHKKMWKILKEMGIPDHFACLLSIQVKKQQLALNLEQWTGSKLGKACVKIVYRHPVYLTFMQSTSCQRLGWMRYKVESRFLGEVSTTSDMKMIPF